MGAFKDKKSGSWYVQFRYTDWQGKRQQKLKRGFATKHEALEWEREFLLQKQTDVTMSFGSFSISSALCSITLCVITACVPILRPSQEIWVKRKARR